MEGAQALYLRGDQSRARWMRIDTARILKRLFFCERALIISQGAWLAGIASFEAKVTLPRFMWQDAMAANALRERVFELRYPSRMMEVGEDAPLIALYSDSLNAPNAAAFLLALARVYVPALHAIYQAYLDVADELSDGPILRHLRIAVAEKETQIETLTRLADDALAQRPDWRADAVQWTEGLQSWLDSLGGLSFETPLEGVRPPSLPARPFQFAEVPARDNQFHRLRYYWPDIVDSSFPYGEGVKLQLRSAVSHFNEVWAVETAGAIVHAFAEELPWEFLFDAARWSYDEARHTQMGFERLRGWGFAPSEMPLGSYIFDSARGEDAVTRLGMLHYFETKNIGKKTKRAEAFADYEDKLSQHDMDFDWADETIHAHYGKQWLGALRERFPERVPETQALHDHCDALVGAEVAAATEKDRAETRAVAEAMLRRAREVMGVGEGVEE